MIKATQGTGQGDDVAFTYGIHLEEDFKEDYNWEKNSMMSKTNSENTGKIVLR